MEPLHEIKVGGYAPSDQSAEREPVSLGHLPSAIAI